MLILLVCFCLVPGVVKAQEPLNTPLDSEDPVYFYGNSISYGGETIPLGSKAIYLDATLSDAICEKYDYVYNDFHKAADNFVNGTESDPMKVYIAPYVYWIDDPDDEAVRQGINGDPVPYARWINCSWLSLNGCNKNPENVVFAVNRGQSHGAIGNYTMFYINGNGTHVENMTLGNYCSVDLNYPLDTSLSRPKRTSTITQAQLVLTNGDKITANNSNFISRLNACPFVGSDKRILFEDCHFECTDDSLPGTAVYVGCDFDFYSSKPFYNTSGTGAVFLGCSFHEKHISKQYMTKAGGIVTIIDGTFDTTSESQYFGWTPDPSNSLRCYQSNITIIRNGTKQTNYLMGSEEQYTTVDLTGDAALSAYKIEKDGKVIYNTYNLLRGSDDWDPMGVKSQVSVLPVQLVSSPYVRLIQTGNSATLTYTGKFFMGTGGEFTDTVTWTLEDSLKNYVTITSQDGKTCKITVKNQGKVNVSGMIYAKSSSGLESGCYVTIAPKKSAAPTFVRAPKLTGPVDGVLSLDYLLSDSDTSEDISSIQWYRCSDANGEDAIQVGISRNDEPMKDYTLSYGDVGYYLMAKITPKQLGSTSGIAKTVIFSRKITVSDVKATNLYTDFKNLPIANQKLILPGFWTLCCYKPEDATGISINENLVGFSYGEGALGGGMAGKTGLITANKGARIVYTPANGTYGDMSVSYVISPGKSAGQLMSKAGYFMEFYVKYDTKTKTGYGLRFERVGTSAKTVTATLYRYNNGTATPISEPVVTSAANTECTVTLRTVGATLYLDVTTTHGQSADQLAENALHEIHTSIEITENPYGGIGIQHVGSVGESAVMINQVEAQWEQSQVELGIFQTYNLGHVVRTDLSKCTISAFAKQYYTGKAITPAVIVKEGNKTLKKGTDYQVTYFNNTNLGTATVEITGIGQYKGSIKKTFEIQVKTGSTYTVGKYRYKVTGAPANGQGTVTLIGVTNKNLKTVNIAPTVNIGGRTFQITAIGDKAFYKNKKLTTVKIGKNVTQIGKSSFASCSKLKKITIKSTKLKKVGKGTWKGIAKKAVIKVPKKQLKKYKKLLKNKGQNKTVKITK